MSKWLNNYESSSVNKLVGLLTLHKLPPATLPAMVTLRLQPSTLQLAD